VVDELSNVQGEELDEFVTAILSASWLLTGISSRSLEAIDGRVTLAQFRTMAVLSQRRKSNLSRLAAELAVNVSTAMRMVDRLVAAGFVSRSENPQTRREVVLCLTPDGEQLVVGVLAHRRAEIGRLLAQMPGGSCDALAAGLRTFTKTAWSAGVRPNAPNALAW
jgi:DNA-binding MarR family transcriptional regulator